MHASNIQVVSGCDSAGRSKLLRPSDDDCIAKYEFQDLSAKVRADTNRSRQGLWT